MKSRNDASVELNNITNKLGLSRGPHIGKRLHNIQLLAMGLSPFDIVALDEMLTEKGLLKDGVSLKEYVESKLNGKLLDDFYTLFGFDEGKQNKE